jgi:hypothetical protein
MGQGKARGCGRENARTTGADGVSVLPFAMAAALVAAGIAINRSVRMSRAAVQQAKAKAAVTSGAAAEAGAGRRDSASATSAPSGQAAVRATVDDDGR